MEISQEEEMIGGEIWGLLRDMCSQKCCDFKSLFKVKECDPALTDVLRLSHHGEQGVKILWIVMCVQKALPDEAHVWKGAEEG